jgi:hypothetical protein
VGCVGSARLRRGVLGAEQAQLAGLLLWLTLAVVIAALPDLRLTLVGSWR